MRFEQPFVGVPLAMSRPAATYHYSEYYLEECDVSIPIKAHFQLTDINISNSIKHLIPLSCYFIIIHSKMKILWIAMKNRSNFKFWDGECRTMHHNRTSSTLTNCIYCNSIHLFCSGNLSLFCRYSDIGNFLLTVIQSV